MIKCSHNNLIKINHLPPSIIIPSKLLIPEIIGTGHAVLTKISGLSDKNGSQMVSFSMVGTNWKFTNSLWPFENKKKNINYKQS